jgi:hypothetical protein
LRNFASPGELARFLELQMLAIQRTEHIALEAAGRAVASDAKAIIGHYQTSDTGPFGPWPPLSGSTLKQKSRRGFSPPDNPLLRTGALRDAIEHHVEGHTAHIGVPNGPVGDIAFYQEMGTNIIPPRSFLGVALYRKADHVADLIGKAVTSVLMGTFRAI